MERVHTLIDKLYHQKQQNASPEHLLFTVQMIHAELLQLSQRSSSFGSSKVAVSLPVNLNFVEEVVRNAMVQASETEAVPVVKEVEPVAVVESRREVAPDPETYSLRKPAEVVVEPRKAAAINTKTVEEAPSLFTPEPPKSVAPESPKPSYQHQPVLNPAFDMEPELPTLGQYASKTVSRKVDEAPAKEVYELKPSREIHELIADSKESLNDLLKEDKKELGHVLTGSPIKDLRKAVGINDRFTFINELFRGDEAMYERSIKTINSFNIYSEAEYWINRELTFKLGWVETNSTVQQFYHLVRRRFS